MEYVGWDEVTTGTLIKSFSKPTDNVAFIRPEERAYSDMNSHNVSVSSWRFIKPVYNRDTCIDCQNCWIYCPDLAIISRDKKMTGIDYEHCKGCGVCVEVCPTNPKSLLMFDENKAVEEALTEWPEKKRKDK